MTKRALDIVGAAAGLLVLAPVFAVVAVLIKLDSPGPVIFRQQRIGRGFRPFWIYKFRTMVQDAPARGALVTVGQDPRITRIGRLLRQSKIDELPQLWNVLTGDMALVGPRPEVPRYVELFRRDYEEILRVRPGLTDLASLKYSDEAAVLGQSEDPEGEYLRRLLPDKVRLAKEYIQRSSIGYDIRLIGRTMVKLFAYRNI
jgi:lipopolysaccharide/colanic/teichoic acid biosynthesis glycosyltransferase